MMLNKIKNKKNLIFIIISTIFILFMIIFYGYRLIHFYKLENPTGSKLVENLSLSESIINNNSIVTSGDGLYYDGDNHTFKGNVTNNYIYYSGLMWRIVRINKDKTIKLVSEEVLTNLNWDYKENVEISSFNNWINDEILLNLSHQEYLINNDTCKDIIEDVKEIKCEKYIENNKIGFLSVNEYIEAEGKKSYLNNSKSWWLSNTDSKNNLWYVNSNGGVSNTNSDESHGIRLTLTLNKTIVSTAGNGSKENPFVIENDIYGSLAQINAGSYLKFSDRVWRVIDKTETAVKVVLDGYLEETKIFDSYNNGFNISSYNNIGSYLNNTFYNSLSNKEYIINGDFYIGEYTNNDYKTTLANKINSKVGLLSIGELFTNEYNNVFLLTPYSDEGMIYTIGENYYLYGNSVKTSLKIRPVIYLDNTLLVTSGNGFKNNPFEIGK